MKAHKIGNYFTTELTVYRKNVNNQMVVENFDNATNINVVMSYATRPSIKLHNTILVNSNSIELYYDSTDSDIQGIYNITVNYSIDGADYIFMYEPIEFVKDTTYYPQLDDINVIPDKPIVLNGQTNFNGLKGEKGYTPIKNIDYFDGKDGHTPVKGVDYFDGAIGLSGYTPIKNVDYFDGVDGYTPVKGVDYFDGADGQDGKDGQNGITPIKGIDYFDGADGINGKDGQDGKDGINPVKGVDYFDGAIGLSGYTPIKNVDYFDGVDGYTPVKGVDYFDGLNGKDGYTPVKNVDYFDGAIGLSGYTPIKNIDYFDGVAGKDGKDGYTPVKGVDYFDGVDGYTPVKGVDYFDGADGADGAAGTIAPITTNKIPKFNGTTYVDSSITDTGNITINNTVTSTGFIKTGGSSTQTLMADGTVSQVNYMKNITEWKLTNATGGLFLGTVGTSAGTFAQSLPTFTLTSTSIKRANYANVVTTTNQVLGVRNTELMFGVTDGFTFFSRCGVSTWTNGGRFFAGLSTANTVVSANPSALNNSIGFGCDDTDNGLLYVISKATGTVSKTSTTLTLTSGKMYDMYLYCAPNGTSIKYSITDINTQVTVTGTINTVPTALTLLNFGVNASNAALTTVTAINLSINKIYLESNY